MLLRDAAAIVRGEAYGRNTFKICNILPPDEACEHDLTFIFNTNQSTKAGAVIAKHRIKGKHGIIIADPRKAMYRMLKYLENKPIRWQLSEKADIAKDVHVNKQCSIGAFAVIEKGVKIGQKTIIGAHCHIHENVCIGKNVSIQSHVVVYPNTEIGDHVEIHSHTVIGKPGFGYVKKRGYERIPHIGGVIIKPFVEIGGNVTIDRATIGHTVIGRGTKIDNLVHIAHNVKIGDHCIIMGQVGIAGSSRIGDHVTLCGQVGVSDHVEIGDHVTVLAKSAVFKSIPPKKRYSGIPAREHHAVIRALGRLYRNP